MAEAPTKDVKFGNVTVFVSAAVPKKLPAGAAAPKSITFSSPHGTFTITVCKSAMVRKKAPVKKKTEDPATKAAEITEKKPAKTKRPSQGQGEEG